MVASEPGTSVTWPRAVVATVVVVAVGVGLLVVVPNLIVTRLGGWTGVGGQDWRRSGSWPCWPGWRGCCAASRPGRRSEDAMSQSPRPPTPDARWLWENEPCGAACPVHTDAGAYVTAIAEGRHRDAYLIARQPNPFPSICGRGGAAPGGTGGW